MTGPSIVHGSFHLDRRYAAQPRRVFAAWSQSAAKLAWFGAPDEAGPERYTLDFRVGGKEYAAGRAPNGTAYEYAAIYQDIVTDARIVYSYEMQIEGRRISVSLAAVQLVPDGNGTRLIYDEHGAFLDGLDEPSERERGTRELLDALDAFLVRDG